MKRIFALFLAATLLAAVPAFAQKQYKVVNTVKLGGEGGWDYLTYDKDGIGCSSRAEATSWWSTPIH